MATLIQICASENDLFGLDGDGIVYQYNFKTNNWMELGHERNDRGESPGGDRPAAGAPRPSRGAAPPARG